MADALDRKLQHAAERCNILLKVKLTVDELLASGSHVTWSTYGGLGRICDNVEQALLHGSRIITPQHGHDGRLASNGLLTLLKNVTTNDEKDLDDLTSINQWIRKCLLSRNLSSKVASFCSVKYRMKKCYYKFAFLRSLEHLEALCQCLRAIEEDNPLLPTSIDYILINKEKYLEKCQKQINDGSGNTDESSSTDSANENQSLETESRIRSKDSSTSKTNESPTNSVCNEIFVPKSSRLNVSSKSTSKFNETVLASAAFKAATEPIDVQNEMRWFEGEFHSSRHYSLIERRMHRNNSHIESSRNRLYSDAYISPKTRSLSSGSESFLSDSKSKDDNGKSELNEPDKRKVLGHYRSKSDQLRRFRPFGTTKQTSFNATQHEKNVADDVLSSSLPTNSDIAEFYGGGIFVSSFSRRPSQTPILGSLSSRMYDACQEFDRENAHFSISEALICAIEEMKCESVDRENPDEDIDADESDEEIVQLRARIRRKKYARKTHQRRSESFHSDTLSLSSPPSSFSSREQAKSTDSDYDSSSEHPESYKIDNDKDSEQQNVIVVGSLLSNSPHETSASPISAEQVALSLLQHVALRKNLKSEDLKWIVSEQDVPQRLLPLPEAVPVSPDDELYDTSDYNASRTLLPCRLRGNLEWAPPRQQIIFSIPPNPKRKEAMIKQGYRCAGCGMRVDPGYTKRLRFCNYIGKYFCNTCHSAKVTVIPARIIQRWDFREYEVSNFAHDLLNGVHHQPLFNVYAINRMLYKRTKEMEDVKFLRLQLRNIASYIRTCRHAVNLLDSIQQIPDYNMSDIHLYSVFDLLKVKSGLFREELEIIVSNLRQHVSNCQLCLAKGFICEYCKDGNDIIYPFEVKKVSQCEECHACYHSKCYVKEKCPKCERLLQRKKAAQDLNEDSDENERI